VIYVLLLIFLITPLHAQAFQDEPLPQLNGLPPETIIKANILSRAIDKLVLGFNGTWRNGAHISGGCYGDSLLYMELTKEWVRLIKQQEPGTLDINLVMAKSKMVKAVEDFVDCLELATKDLKKVRKATRNLPPK